MKQLVSLIGDIKLNVNKNNFEQLVTSIIGQQLSAKTAALIISRLRNLVEGQINITSIEVLEDEQLRNLGISLRKVSFIRDLCSRIKSNLFDVEQLHSYSNSEVIEILTEVKGIGVWTAQMFLIFSLGRLDVLPLGDQGLQRASLWLYSQSDKNGIEVLEDSSKMWKPFYTIPCLYLWKAVDLNLLSKSSNIEGNY
ncbi:DNA-3-methyladenine glycosylase family protein [Heyndrickxia camelliae]|nr:DNA-3-methyladenine glycosylase 2 family protein [Heyndrickxia camelliae]